MESLGGVLRNRRLALGLSLRHVARVAGISPSYLVALEQGRNPTTGRPPMPSPRVIAALGGALGIARSAILELAAAPPSSSPHVLLYQAGARTQSPAEAGRLLFGDAVDGWVEVVSPDAPEEDPADDIRLRVVGPLGSRPAGRQAYAPERALAALEALLADHRDVVSTPRLGLIFGAASRSRGRGSDLCTLLRSEATWESDVASLCRRVLGIEPVANICVYREADLRRRARESDPLTSGLKLIRAHPVVAAQCSPNGVVTGPAAIETMLVGLAPPETEAHTWKELAGAAAIGLVSDTAVLPAGSQL